jgi:predicted anti-sigma-YlaC factor YlaD
MTQHLSSDILVDYLHGALAPADDAAAYEHIESCAGCRAEYDAEVALTELLRAQAARDERELPSAVKAAIWAQVRAGKPALWSQLAAAFRPVVAVPALAAIGLAAYLGTAYLGPHGAPSIAASYYLQDHAAMQSTIPFSDRNSMTPVDLESAAASDTQQVAVNVEPAVYTADASH